MTKNGKKIIIISTIAIIIALLSFLILYFVFNVEDENSSFTLMEKQWIENNKKTLVDVDVVNGMSIISNNGEGVIFDFLNDFEDITGLEFNKKPYEYNAKLEEKSTLSFNVSNSLTKLGEKDLLLWRDNYVVLGKSNTKLSGLVDLKSSKIGILSSDRDILTYATKSSSVVLQTYNDISSLLSAYEKENVKYIMVSNFMYLSYTYLVENLYPVYHLNNVSNNVVLTLGNNEKLNNIVEKYFEKWKTNNLDSAIANNLLAFYYNNHNELTELDKSTLTSKSFKLGYVDLVPYIFEQGDSLYGIASEYLNLLVDSANVEFEMVKYSDNDSLKKALQEQKIDIAVSEFNYDIASYHKTKPLVSGSLAILSKKYKLIDSKYALTNYSVYTTKDTSLSNYLKNYTKNLIEINDIGENIDDDILVIDKNKYLAYKDSKLEDYKLLALDTYDSGVLFYVSDSDKVLYNFLDFVTTYTNDNYYFANGMNGMDISILDKTNFVRLYIVLLCIIFLPLILILVFRKATKRHLQLKTLKKQDILKYTDLLTSLKNRNYLNKNIPIWDDMKIYPRTIIMVDLNNLKYVNDKYGHEEGNKLIVRAASVLINTQLEKSEIVRSDGNEFLIYLLGYREKQILTYINKLKKEFDKLPYNFGAAIGYSVIEDETKSIDDAISEASIAMRKGKENSSI